MAIDPKNSALYFPTIEFQDREWLLGASLVWDRIYRIVPEHCNPNDADDLKPLLESGDIGAQLRPDKYAEGATEEFMAKIESKEWDASAFTFDQPEEYMRLHKDKADVALRNLIVANGTSGADEEWLDVPKQFGTLYMIYLARKIAESNNLSIVSDMSTAWTGATYMQHDGQIEPAPFEDLDQQLAIFTVKNFLPINISEIDPKKIAQFREKYSPERKRFISAIRKMTTNISSCSEPDVIRGVVEDSKKEIKSALDDFKKSAEAISVAGWTGTNVVSYPIFTTVATVLFGATLPVSSIAVAGVSGLFLGLTSGILGTRDKHKKLRKDCDYAYLLTLGKRGKGLRGRTPDPSILFREMEEFIND